MRTLTFILFFGLLSITECKSQSSDSLLGLTSEQTQIDSQVAIIDTKANCNESISEGEITKNGKNIGGFSTYSLYDKTNKKLFRIRNQESTNLYHKTTFYYANDEVIFARIEIEDWNSRKTKVVYDVKYYFRDDKLIEVLNEDKKYSNSNDVLTDGKKYLENYYQNLKEDELIFKH